MSFTRRALLCNSPLEASMRSTSADAVASFSSGRRAAAPGRHGNTPRKKRQVLGLSPDICERPESHRTSDWHGLGVGRRGRCVFRSHGRLPSVRQAFSCDVGTGPESEGPVPGTVEVFPSHKSTNPRRAKEGEILFQGEFPRLMGFHDKS